MARAKQQAFAARIVVQVIELLRPESFRVRRFGLPGWLPETSFAVGGGSVAQRFLDAAWTAVAAVNAKVGSSETKIGKQ